jgi:hypothetical protein
MRNRVIANGHWHARLKQIAYKVHSGGPECPAGHFNSLQQKNEQVTGIWGSHSGVCKDSSLLEYDAVPLGQVFFTLGQSTRAMCDGGSLHGEVEFLKATLRESTHPTADT